MYYVIFLVQVFLQPLVSTQRKYQTKKSSLRNASWHFDFYAQCSVFFYIISNQTLLFLTASYAVKNIKSYIIWITILNCSKAHRIIDFRKYFDRYNFCSNALIKILNKKRLKMINLSMYIMRKYPKNNSDNDNDC